MSQEGGLWSTRTWLHLLLLRPLLRLLFGVNIQGRDHIRRLERFILVANHNSHLDVLLIFLALPWRLLPSTRPVAALDYFGERRVLRWLVDALFRPVWIVRGGDAGANGVGEPLRAMRSALEAGANLIVFPEGTRGEPGRITRFRSGIGRLVQGRPDVPVVPAYLSGPERSLPKGGVVPVPLWNRVVIGPPQRMRGEAREVTASLEGMIRDLAASEAATRHKRSYRSRRVPTLAVLGIDGSGKSTVSELLAKALSKGWRVCRIGDTLEIIEDGESRRLHALPMERVRQALALVAKGARSLESYKIPKLSELLIRNHLLDEVRRWHAPEVIVLDGSPLLNLLAWARIYGGDRINASVLASAVRVVTGAGASSRSEVAFEALPELALLDRLRLARLHLPEAAILLDLEPAVALVRVLARGAPVQAHETRHRLERLRDSYLMVCEVVRREFGVQVRMVPACEALEEVAAKAESFADEILSSIKEAT